MTAFLKNDVWGDASGADFEHILLKDKMFSPELFYVGFDGAADGTEIVETSAATIYLAALEVDESPFEEIIE